ncbi:MAG: hypothetical protein KJ697_00280 [Nanoarchaeota archaeon]|nr:hypothetical protein [Nanoarchaeota archaeon]MBU4124247.1 hypothetical protein [Nanoarchaeota archaeon]
MVSEVINGDEFVQKDMLSRTKPFTINEMVEKHNRGSISINNTADYLVKFKNVFYQTIGSKKHYINRDHVNPEEIAKIRLSDGCAYTSNDEILKTICEEFCSRLNRRIQSNNRCNAYYFKFIKK